jgi:hypothetical protein
MRVIGLIKGKTEGERINPNSWIDLIRSHPSLSSVPPRTGINPFTRAPIEFKAPATSAIVSIDGEEIGSISWAQDDTPLLFVEAEPGSERTVAGIAEELAKTLGGIFVRESDASA